MAVAQLNILYKFAVRKYGRLAEWLGSGLQNRVRRFESATDLLKIVCNEQLQTIFCFF